MPINAELSLILGSFPSLIRSVAPTGGVFA